MLGKKTEIGNAGKDVDKAVQDLQAVLAKLRIFVHDHDALEEQVDLAQGGKFGQRRRIIVGLEGAGYAAFRLDDSARQGVFDLAQQRFVVVNTELRVADCSARP
ncbi:MAG: hypothetical protein ACLT98_01615 [Eggerthellaceae bacterium]